MATRSRTHKRVPAIEWITGLAGLAIVLGTVGFIAYEAFRGGAEVPSLALTVERSKHGADGVVALVSVRNDSRQAAAEVLLEGVMRLRDGGEQRSQARFDYVPGHSTRRATLLFPAAREAGHLEVRILGYTTP